MNRRQFNKAALTGGALAITAPSVLVLEGCGSTTQYVRWTDTVIGALSDVSPILVDMGAQGVVGLVAKAIPIAKSLREAFKSNDHAATLQFLDNLINPDSGIIVEIANAVGALANDNRKRIVLGGLAIGMVALRLIAANIENEVPATSALTAKKARPKASDSVTRAASAGKLEAAFNAAKF